MNLGPQWDGADNENFDALYAQIVKLPEKSTPSTITTWVLESLGDVEVAVAVMRELGNHGWLVSAQMESEDKSTTVFFSSDPQDT